MAVLALDTTANLKDYSGRRVHCYCTISACVGVVHYTYIQAGCSGELSCLTAYIVISRTRSRGQIVSWFTITVSVRSPWYFSRILYRLVGRTLLCTMRLMSSSPFCRLVLVSGSMLVLWGSISARCQCLSCCQSSSPCVDVCLDGCQCQC